MAEYDSPGKNVTEGSFLKPMYQVKCKNVDVCSEKCVSDVIANQDTMYQ